MKQITTNFNDYKSILCAERVEIHHLVQYFKKKDIDYDEHGNIFIGFSDETQGLPILVAHLDNVLEGKRTPIFDLNKRILSGKDAGIGFDDKAGIIGIIQLWRLFKKKQMFRIIFTADEEIGGVGARKIDPSIYADAKWMLELDRKNNKDFIQTSGGTRLCSDEFAQKFLDMGFELAQGVFTDVNVFKEQIVAVNMANISIGYYNPHTDSEYLDTKQFDEIITKVAHFIAQEYDFADDKEDEKPLWYNSGLDHCWNCGTLTRRQRDADGRLFCGDECKEDYEDYIGR